MTTDTIEPPKSDDKSGITDIPKSDDLGADAIRKEADSLTSNEILNKYVGGVQQVQKANAEAKEFRLKADANKLELDTIKKEIEDNTKKGLEDNKKFEELYNTEKEKNEKFEFYKKFHDDQIEVINGQITDMEGKLSNQSKELYEVFKGNEKITPTEKLKFLSKAMVESGIDVDRSQSKGGAKLDPKTATLTEKMEYYQRTGKKLE